MKGLEMVKCKSLRINMFRITHTGKSMNFPVTESSMDETFKIVLVYRNIEPVCKVCLQLSRES